MGSLAVLVAVALDASILRAEERAMREVVLATTTSVQDAGLLGVLLPPFREKTGIDVKVIAVGSGAALRLARDGNADLVLAHAPEGEEKLVAEGVVLDRRALAENFFVIAGPDGDPAQVRGAPTAADAVRRIAGARAPFVSRGDDSGTHQRERELFTQAGLGQDAAWPGLLRTGAGMGQTLLVAGEKRAYVLTDGATFRAFRERTGLAALTGRDPALRNVYSVLRVDPEKFPPGRIHSAEAQRLAEHLLSAEMRDAIARFGAAEGEGPLFAPARRCAMSEASLSPLVEIALRTLAVSGCALALAVALGLPVGLYLGGRRFRGRGVAVSLVNAAMGLPPVVVGLVVAILLWRSGPLGSLGLMYTPVAMVIAQVAIALPLVVGISHAAVGALGPEWGLQVRALGIHGARALWLLLRETRLGLLAAVIAALGGILSEVGAVMMVGGNLEGQTRVLTTGILMYTQMGRFHEALALSAVLLGITFVLAGTLTAVQQAGRR